MNIRLNGNWNANTIDFEQDTKREYDWVYSVANMGYTRFNKEERVIEKLTNIEPKKAICEGKDVTVIGLTQWLFEDFDRYIIVSDGIVEHGVHPSIVEISR